MIARRSERFITCHLNNDNKTTKNTFQKPSRWILIFFRENETIKMNFKLAHKKKTFEPSHFQHTRVGASSNEKTFCVNFKSSSKIHLPRVNYFWYFGVYIFEGGIVGKLCHLSSDFNGKFKLN